jgi:hypothetical protein
VRVAGARGAGRCLDGGTGLSFTSKPMLAGQSLYALVAYEVKRPAAHAGSIASLPPSRSGAVPLDRPRGLELVNLGRPLRVSLPRGARACVRSLAVGWLGSNGR